MVCALVAAMREHADRLGTFTRRCRGKSRIHPCARPKIGSAAAPRRRRRRVPVSRRPACDTCPASSS